MKKIYTSSPSSDNLEIFAFSKEGQTDFERLRCFCIPLNGLRCERAISRLARSFCRRRGLGFWGVSFFA